MRNRGETVDAVRRCLWWDAVDEDDSLLEEDEDGERGGLERHRRSRRSLVRSMVDEGNDGLLMLS